MSKKFISRLFVTTGVGLVVLAFYGVEAFHEGFHEISHALIGFLVTLSVFFGWFGLEQLWDSGRKRQAGVLGAVLFFSVLNNLMYNPSPRWTLIVIVSISIYSIISALWFRRGRGT
jgi:hypothetical protein